MILNKTFARSLVQFSNFVFFHNQSHNKDSLHWNLFQYLYIFSVFQTLLLWSIFFQRQKNDVGGLYSSSEKKSMNLNDEQINELFSEINKWRK